MGRKLGEKQCWDLVSIVPPSLRGGEEDGMFFFLFLSKQYVEDDKKWEGVK